MEGINFSMSPVDLLICQIQSRKKEKYCWNQYSKCKHIGQNWNCLSESMRHGIHLHMR